VKFIPELLLLCYRFLIFNSIDSFRVNKGMFNIDYLCYRYQKLLCCVLQSYTVFSFNILRRVRHLNLLSTSLLFMLASSHLHVICCVVLFIHLFINQLIY